MKKLRKEYRNQHERPNGETLDQHIAGMKDKLIHNYFGVDLSAIRKSVEEDLGPLKHAAHRMLESSITHVSGMYHIAS